MECMLHRNSGQFGKIKCGGAQYFHRGHTVVVMVGGGKYYGCHGAQMIMMVGVVT